jgi:hypothetical protein
MVAFVRVAHDGRCLEIKEVPDKFRDEAYVWDEDE